MFIKNVKKTYFFRKKVFVILSLLFLNLKIFADIICPVCGEKNPDDSKFCGFCGTPIETLKSQTNIEFPRELMEYSRKPEDMLKKRNKTSLILGLVNIIVGAGMSIYGFTKQDITKDVITYSNKLESLDNINVDGYYYPKGEFKITNNGNTVAKNFLVEIKFYGGSQNLIKTEYVNLSVNIEPEKSLLQTIETDTGKNSVATTKVEIIDYQIEGIYKIKDENLGWWGVVVFGFGLYNLIKYYNQTVSSERDIVYLKNEKNFSLVMTFKNFYILYTGFNFKFG